LFLTRPRLADHMRDVQEVQVRADAVFSAINSNSLQIQIEGEYTLDDIAHVHDRIERREQIGKSIVRV
jgi:NADPH:quinone reductase-like Zn-dependent oxidoreductase